MSAEFEDYIRPQLQSDFSEAGSTVPDLRVRPVVNPLSEDECLILGEQLREHPTIGAMQQHLRGLYETHNQEAFTNQKERLEFLQIAISDLSRQFDRQRSLTPWLARVFSRTMAVTTGFHTEPAMAKIMAEKYPPNECGYCHTMPCTCPPGRKDPVYVQANETQMQWTISEWQQHFQKLYGEDNRKGGPDRVLRRLRDEADEVLEAQKRIERPSAMSSNDVAQRYDRELADVMAWIFAVGNFFDISVQDAVVDRYANGCSFCQAYPCHCDDISFEQAT